MSTPARRTGTRTCWGVTCSFQQAKAVWAESTCRLPNFDSCVVMSLVSPSQKYFCRSSRPRLRNGRTTMLGAVVGEKASEARGGAALSAAPGLRPLMR